MRHLKRVHFTLAVVWAGFAGLVSALSLWIRLYGTYASDNVLISIPPYTGLYRVSRVMFPALWADTATSFILAISSFVMGAVWFEVLTMRRSG